MSAESRRRTALSACDPFWIAKLVGRLWGDRALVLIVPPARGGPFRVASHLPRRDMTLHLLALGADLAGIAGAEIQELLDAHREPGSGEGAA